MTFGFYSENVDYLPATEPWVCRKHHEAIEKWNRKKYPEDFDD